MSILCSKFLNRLTTTNRLQLVDVGSMGGVESEWQTIEQDIAITGFEPDTREFVKLMNSANKIYFDLALAERSKDLNYYVSRDGGKSSVFEPNEELLNHFADAARFETVEKRVIPANKVSNLDSVLENHLILDPDFLKLDTQGSELAILQGSTRCLENALIGLKVEIGFIEVYLRQPLFAELDTFIRSYGFELMDIRRTYWKRRDYTSYGNKGQLAFGDALYLKQSNDFFARLENADQQYSQDKIIKFVVTCLIYGLSDVGISILNQAYARGLINNGLLQEAVASIVAEERRLKPFFFAACRLLKTFGCLFRKRFKPNALDYYDGDPYIGSRTHQGISRII